MNSKRHMAENIEACYPLSLHRSTWAVESSSAGTTQSCFSSATTTATAGTLWKNRATRTVMGTTRRAPSSTPARMASGRWLSSPWISTWLCSELFVKHCCVVSHLCGIMQWVVCGASLYSELFVEIAVQPVCGAPLYCYHLWSITLHCIACEALLFGELFLEHHYVVSCMWSVIMKCCSWSIIMQWLLCGASL